MKKAILVVFTLITAFASADKVKLPDFPNGDRSLGIAEPAVKARRAVMGNMSIDNQVQPSFQIKESGVAPRMISMGEKKTTPNHAGYLNPKGTLFLGMDEAGAGTWFNKGGIVGAWSDSIDHWTFKQTVTGDFDSIMYTNYALKSYPSAFEDTKYFYTDKDYNWCDSIVASGGFQEAYAMDIYGDNTQYPWPSDMPLQTVYRKDTVEHFMLLCQSAKPSVKEAGFIVGGLPSANSSDGLWPLTNAVNISREGISMDYIATTDPDQYTHYIFGSDSLTLDTTIVADDTIYTRVAPKRIVTQYDCPQAPLYVKSITVLLGAKGSNKIVSKIQIKQLRVNVLDKNNNIIATSTATSKDLSKVSFGDASMGRMLTFKFAKRTDYNELVSEGFLVSDSFRVEITDIASTDTFGIFSAKSTLHASKSYVEYEDGTIAAQDYDPYIMLNGIYNTLENYVLTEKVSKFIDAENSGDTIPINMVSVNSQYYQYRGYYAAEDLKEGNTFEYYSTFMPYDSVSRYWLMDVSKPDYIELGCDFDTNFGTEDNPVTAWSYIRVFDLYIYATSTPRIGDIIRLGKCGRQTVFRIRAINGATAIGETSAAMKQSNVQKILDQNGLVRILKGNKSYNLLGQPTNK